MTSRRCQYIVKPRDLIDDDSIPDQIYRRYDKLLVVAWEETGSQYVYTSLSNVGLAQLWGVSEVTARQCLAEMRAFRLVETWQVGRTERRIRLLVAWRGQGKDSPAEINAAARRDLRLEAQAPAAEAPVQIEVAEFEDDGGTNTLDDLPNSTINSSSKEEENTININARTQKSTAGQAEGDETKAHEIWRAALSELKLQMTKATFDAWLRPSRARRFNGTALVVVLHTAYAKEWLEKRLDTTVRRTLIGIMGHPIEIRYETPNDD